MKIGLIVEEAIDFDIEHNLNIIIETMKKQSNYCDLIFFGEGFLNGFDGVCFDYKEDLEKNFIDKSDKTIDIIKRAAIDYSIAVGFGFYEKIKDDLYDTYMVIDSFGNEVCCYRRISPYWKPERLFNSKYKDGKDIVPFEINEVKMVLGVCGDLYVEDTRNMFKSYKADIYIWPLAMYTEQSEWDLKEENIYKNIMLEFENDVLFVSTLLKIPGNISGGAMYSRKKDNTIVKSKWNVSDILYYDYKK
jgi:N-carbamoylputrescine amidase